MPHLEAHMVISGDMGRMEIWSSSSGEPSKLSLGDMEANVWAHLPHSVLTDQILMRLPLMSNVRSRCVCRDWNQILSSYSPPPTRSICFFGSLGKVSGRVYNPLHHGPSPPIEQSEKNQPITISTLNTIKLDFSFLPKSELLQPCAAGGGLICFRRNSGRKSQEPPFRPGDFYMCNPITKKYKQLGGMQKELSDPDQVDDDIVQVIYELIVDVSNEYRFFAGRVGMSMIKLHIYDSRTSSWTNNVTQEHPESYNMRWDMETVPVFHHGQLKLFDVLHSECEMEKRNMQTKKPYAALTVSHGSSYRIVGAQDSVFAIEVMMYPNKGLEIWRRDETGWESVSALPRDSAEVILGCFTAGKSSQGQYLHCQMCWFSDCFLCIKLSKANTARMLTFQLKTKTWQLWDTQFAGVPDTMFSFTPSLEEVP